MSSTVVFDCPYKDHKAGYVFSHLVGGSKVVLSVIVPGHYHTFADDKMKSNLIDKNTAGPHLNHSQISLTRETTIYRRTYPDN